MRLGFSVRRAGEEVTCGGFLMCGEGWVVQGPELRGCSPKAPPGQGVGAVTGKELREEVPLGVWTGPGYVSCELKGSERGTRGNPGVSLNGDRMGLAPGQELLGRTGRKERPLYQLAQPVSCCSVSGQDVRTGGSLQE